MNRKLSISDEQKIISLYGEGNSSRDIAKIYNVDKRSILMCLKRNRIKRRDPILPRSALTNENKKEIVERYMNGESMFNLGKQFNCSDSRIEVILKNNKKNKRIWDNDARRKYSVNDSVFDSLNENSLYWLGFLATDGCLPSKGKGIQFVLKESDWEHVDNFRKFVNFNGSVKFEKQNKSARIYFTSRPIRQRLIELKITPVKSRTLSLSKELKNCKDFWRGCIDGDGSVGIKQSGYPFINFCGTEDMVRGWHSFIKNNIIKDLKVNPFCVRKEENFYVLNICNKKTVPLITNYIYNNSKNGFRLERKYQKYLEIKRMYENN